MGKLVNIKKEILYSVIGIESTNVKNKFFFSIGEW